MEHYFITGTGSGIGKSLAEKLVKDAKVTGLSRSNSIHHPNFTFYKTDLSRPAALENFSFALPDHCERAVLINNAGSVGAINRAGRLNDRHFEEVFYLNLITLAQLCNRFLNEATVKTYPCLIINISSGAANHPIPSWSAYCAAKAGVDMFTRVLDAELKEVKNTNTRVFSFHPAVVDTGMQTHIRSADEDNFSSKIRFNKLYEEGELLSPDFVAEKLLGIFKDPEQIVSPIVSIRDFI